MILGQPCLDPKSFTQSSLELVGSLSSAFDMLEESTEHKQDGHQLRVRPTAEAVCFPKGAQLFSLKSHVPTAWIWHLICLYPQRDEGKLGGSAVNLLALRWQVREAWGEKLDGANLVSIHPGLIVISSFPTPESGIYVSGRTYTGAGNCRQYGDFQRDQRHSLEVPALPRASAAYHRSLDRSTGTVDSGVLDAGEASAFVRFCCGLVPF